VTTDIDNVKTVGRVVLQAHLTNDVLGADPAEVRKILGEAMEKLLDAGTVVDLEQLDGNPTSDELGARAARLVADMLQQAGRYLTHGYGEINEVLLEARVRGWLEPIE
jgi:hypothetical protein